MKILIIDRSTEARARLARKLQALDSSELEALNATLHLGGEEEIANRIGEMDVIVLGPQLGDSGTALARHARKLAPNIEIIMIVDDLFYTSGVFREARPARVRKVLAESASALDFLQELQTINDEFLTSGTHNKPGRVIAVLQAKGGVGATTIAAALGEVTSLNGRKTLLWDLDIETNDLSRALKLSGAHHSAVSAFVRSSREINRESFKDAVFHVNQDYAVLPPPTLAAAIEFAASPDAIPLCKRLVDCARQSNQVVIVDLAGRLGPAAGAVLMSADIILMVLDDSVIGLTGAHALLGELMPMIKNPDALRILCSGVNVPVETIAEQFDNLKHLGETPWQLPIIPFDETAEQWPGSGKSLYSVGGRAVQRAIEELAERLDLIPKREVAPQRKGFFQRFSFGQQERTPILSVVNS